MSSLGYDGNKNITISIYQILVSISQGLQWLFNANIFKIVSNIMSKTSQNIMFTLRIATSMVNDVEHVMQIRLENTIVKGPFHVSSKSQYIVHWLMWFL
jgi:hypothetical protein